MKKNKFILSILLSVMFLIGSLSVVGCGSLDVEKHNNIEENGIIYIDSEQTITLDSRTPLDEGDAAQFKNTITVADIVLSSNLAGKTISSVSYVSESSIQVVLSGKTTSSFSGKYAEGKITVKSNALLSSGDAYCFAYVYKPMMSASMNLSSGNATSKTFTSYYILPYGTFISENVNTDKIKLSTNENGTIEVSLSSNELSITVSNFDTTTVAKPTITIDKSVTSFQKDLTVVIGSLYSASDGILLA